MRWAILAVVVLGLADEAAGQGPSLTVNLDGNSQVLPLAATFPATSPPHPPGSMCYIYRTLVAGREWQVNVGTGPRIDQMQFRVVGGFGPLASSPFLPIGGGSGVMAASEKSPAAAALHGKPVTVSP